MSVGRTPGVSLRAALAGAVFVGAISIISPWASMVVKGSQLTNNAIPTIGVLFFILLTAVLVPILGSLSRRLAFSRTEPVTVHVMMLVGSVVVTTGFTGSFLSVVTGPAWTMRRSWWHRGCTCGRSRPTRRRAHDSENGMVAVVY